MRQQHPLLANHGLGRHPQIGRGVLARQLCTLDKRVEDDFGTALGLATVVVFAPDHWTADVRSAALLESGAWGSSRRGGQRVRSQV